MIKGLAGGAKPPPLTPSPVNYAYALTHRITLFYLRDAMLAWVLAVALCLCRRIYVYLLNTLQVSDGVQWRCTGESVRRLHISSPGGHGGVERLRLVSRDQLLLTESHLADSPCTRTLQVN